MPTWILLTFVSAFLQNMRSVLQKHLKGRLSTTGATFVRFGFGLPFAFLYLLIWILGSGHPLPVPGWDFLAWAIIGGGTQIGGTFLLVHLFSFRNFAVGTAYSRTEPAQAALFALVFFGEGISLPVILAIAISVTGVMLISVARSTLTPASLITSVLTPTAGIGLLSGTFFGLSAVSYRSASLSLAPSLPAPDYVMQAGVTLAVVILLQTVAMALYMGWREREQFAKIIEAWKPSLATGFVGATASFGWFMAMTLQQASIVKALAQVEMLFTFASSVFIFRERINRLEIAGCSLIVVGILLLLA
ncbi:EamA family transporter [Rhizobium alvei]|uniref:EamA family transporter n=1 Tax=Rhizobium alvei TaxID=1132659 RepID=A0ABT8YPC9_9HYPH|nr:EamA family transporter [Rhizobium alvei]MDO6965169.1 EamA family transporter [Rhizobium alvei]